MPATTPNRGYPYSIPTDNNDVAGAIQALAEAVDTDLFSLSPSILARRVARVSRTTPVNFGTTSTAQNVVWDSLDVNVRGAVDVFPGVFGDRIVPAFTGWWMGVAEISYQTVPSALTPFTYVDLEIDTNGVRRGRNSDSDFITDTGASRTTTLTVGGGYLMNGTTDYFSVTSSIIRGSGNPNASISLFNASMTIWQLTES